jgi:protein required for attachment to host cells
MRNGQLLGLPENRSTWLMVATRSEAKIFWSKGGVKDFREVRHLYHPDGRLKNRELETDRDGKGKPGGGNAEPVHGLVNKNGAKTHVREVFAETLAEVLEKGRNEEEYKRLILVCEPKILGEIRKRLDEPTLSRLHRTVDKVLPNLSEQELHSRLLDWAV